jgi:hypothetical protein
MMASMFWRGLWLSVGYAEVGPADGPAVLVLHSWPYDMHGFADVAPLLASAGYLTGEDHTGDGLTTFGSGNPLSSTRDAQAGARTQNQACTKPGNVSRRCEMARADAPGRR